MDAQESLKIVLDALHELKKQHITRQTLIDFVRGIESRSVTDMGLQKLETFGQGDKREELHYNLLIDQALEEGLLKMVDESVVATQRGQRFRKSPTAFVLKEDSEETEPNAGDNALLDSLVEKALNDDKDEETLEPIALPPCPSTAKSQQMIHLIQAIDRKVPLDDYAEQNQLDFDTVLDTLEHLIQRGTQLDIHYFTDEVLGQEALDELFDFFDENDGNVEKAIDEFYGIYQPEEIRLARLVWE